MPVSGTTTADAIASAAITETQDAGGRHGSPTSARPPEDVGPSHRNLGLALAIISAAQLMVVLDATIVNVALPSIQRQLHFSSVNLEWVITGYALAFGGLLLLGGRTGDLFGRRRMFVTGVLLFTAASFLGGLATDQAWLIAARVLQGIGGAIAAPTALSLIADTFPEGPQRNRAMGVYAAMSGGGGALGLLLGGILTDLASWRWVLFVNVPIGLLVAFAAPRVLGETGRQSGRLDLPGALTVSGGMTSLVYSLAHAASNGWANAGTIVPLALSVCLLVAFVGIEARSEHALMPLKIFANRNRSGAYAIMLTLGAAMFSLFFFLTQYVQNILGYSPLKAGLAFLPLTVGIVVMAGIMSRVVGRIGTRLPMTIGPLVTTGALVWISRISVHSGYLEGVLGPALLVAVSMGTAFVPLTLSAVAGVPRHEAGLASALLNTGQQVGGSLGLAILVTVATAVTRGQHHVTSAVAVTTGYGAAFRVGAGLAAAAFFIALFSLRTRRDGTSLAPVMEPVVGAEELVA
ncbi:MAG TPA: MFS transporter [Acidimicrobiales bacterium]|nr:MFS transporter [Acidimicrobiales bacterium]